VPLQGSVQFPANTMADSIGHSLALYGWPTAPIIRGPIARFVPSGQEEGAGLLEARGVFAGHMGLRPMHTSPRPSGSASDRLRIPPHISDSPRGDCALGGCPKQAGEEAKSLAVAQLAITEALGEARPARRRLRPRPDSPVPGPSTSSPGAFTRARRFLTWAQFKGVTSASCEASMSRLPQRFAATDSGKEGVYRSPASGQAAEFFTPLEQLLAGGPARRRISLSAGTGNESPSIKLFGRMAAADSKSMRFGQTVMTSVK